MSDRGQMCGPTYTPVTIGIVAIVGILVFDEIEASVQSPPTDAFLAELIPLAAVGFVAVLAVAYLYFRPRLREDDSA